MSGVLERPQPYRAAPNYKASVPTYASLPVTGNEDGDLRLVLDTDVLYVWDQPTTSWILASTAPSSHALGGSSHTTDTLANLNLKITDANLDDAGTSRPPIAHTLGGAAHSADTLANLNVKISDATLIDTGDARLSDDRTPLAHDLAGAKHNAATLAQLNAKISDATLIDTGDSRLSDARTPLAHTHRIPIVITFFVHSDDMAIGTKKGLPSRIRVHPSLGAFTLQHVEIEHTASASVTVDVNKGAGDGAASTIYTTQANRPATSSATRNTSVAPDITAVAADDYFEIDIDALSGTPGGMNVYIRGYKDVAMTP